MTLPAAPDEVPDDDEDESVAAAGMDVEGLAEVLADLDAVVSGFAPLIEGPDVAALRPELAWARAIVDEAHGLEGTVDVLSELLSDLDPSLRLGPVEQRLQLVVNARSAERRDEVESMLAQPEWANLLEHADRLVLTAPIAGTKSQERREGARPGPRRRRLGRPRGRRRRGRRGAAGPTAPAPRSSRPVISAATTVAVTARVTKPVLGKQARKLADAAEAMAACARRAPPQRVGGALAGRPRRHRPPRGRAELHLRRPAHRGPGPPREGRRGARQGRHRLHEAEAAQALS